MQAGTIHDFTMNWHWFDLDQLTYILVPAPDEIIWLCLVCKLFVSSLHICLHWFSSIWRLNRSTRSALSLCWKKLPSLFGRFWELAWLNHKVWTKQWFALLFACKQNSFLPHTRQSPLDTALGCFFNDGVIKEFGIETCTTCPRQP